MLKNFKLNKSLKASVAGIAAAALLITPAGAVVANGSRDNNRNHNNNHDSRNNNRWDQGWWSDWRYGEGKKDWENKPQTCEQRQESVERQTDRLERSSKTQVQKLSWQIDYQQWYADRHDLSPAGFSDLIITAEVNKIEAKEAINALAAPTVDCEKTVEDDKLLLQANKQPVISALRDYHLDAVSISYAVQAAK